MGQRKKVRDVDQRYSVRLSRDGPIGSSGAVVGGSSGRRGGG